MTIRRSLAAALALLACLAIPTAAYAGDGDDDGPPYSVITSTPWDTDGYTTPPGCAGTYNCAQTHRPCHCHHPSPSPSTSQSESPSPSPSTSPSAATPPFDTATPPASPATLPVTGTPPIAGFLIVALSLLLAGAAAVLVSTVRRGRHRA